MPRMPETIEKSVFYIYPSEKDAIEGSELGATGFFFQEKSKALPNKAHTYAITNAHVIFREGMQNPIIRINSKDDKFDIISTSQNDWERHPNGDDVAICPIQMDMGKYNIVSIKRNDFIDHDYIREFNIGPGDDVVMVGRFRVHAGMNKNLPAHCFGNIAKMNEEPLNNQYTQLMQESIIAEMRSISGFSGSPVIVYITPASFRFKDGFLGGKESLEPIYRQKFLGIQWGHIIYQVKAKDEHGRQLKIETDSAMVGIVPAWKILELIDSEEFVEMREKIDKRITEEIEDSGKN